MIVLFFFWSIKALMDILELMYANNIIMVCWCYGVFVRGAICLFVVVLMYFHVSLFVCLSGACLCYCMFVMVLTHFC